MLAWSSGSSSQAHITQNEIFRKWSDLDKRTEQRVTIYDDRFNVYKDEDLKRIQNVSQLGRQNAPIRAPAWRPVLGGRT